jgi:tyrosyl-tRNA synthetase
LYETLDCKIQFGGSDQWGTYTAGLELIRKKQGDKHEAVGLSSPLLLKSDGEKFGKSESGALWLDAELTSPYEIYQYFLNVSDADVINYLKTLTLLKRDVIETLESSMIQQPEAREAQKALANEIVLLIHGKEALEEAIAVSEALFTGEFASLKKSGYQMLAKTLDTAHLNRDTYVVDALIETGLSQSKRESRNFVASNAVVINGIKVTDDKIKLSEVTPFEGQFIILRRGKKKYAMIVLKA